MDADKTAAKLLAFLYEQQNNLDKTRKQLDDLVTKEMIYDAMGPPLDAEREAIQNNFCTIYECLCPCSQFDEYEVVGAGDGYIDVGIEWMDRDGETFGWAVRVPTDQDRAESIIAERVAEVRQYHTKRAKVRRGEELASKRTQLAKLKKELER